MALLVEHLTKLDERSEYFGMAAILICELHKILAAMSTGHRPQSWHVPPMDAAQLADDSGDPL